MHQSLPSDSVSDMMGGALGMQISLVQIAELPQESRNAPFQKITPCNDPADPERQRAVQLIGRIATGDETALAELYRHFAPMLYGLALKMMRDNKEAEDVLQEGFVYIWRKASAYNPQLGGPLSWAVRIVRNKAIDRLRSMRREHRFVERAAIEISHSRDVDERSSEEPMFSEKRAIVRTALAQIPNEQREAIELAFFSGLTHEEIAMQLATPLGTIKARIRRGLLRLKHFVMEAR